MSFLGSLFFLASLVCGVFVPVYFGRGLADGDPARMAMSLVFVALAALCIFIFSRIERRRT